MGRRKTNSAARTIQAPAAKRSRARTANKRGKRCFFGGLRRVVQIGVTGALSLFRLACSSLRRIRATRQEKALVVRDTASLGEKRFVAVVEVGSERYLIGGSANSVALLASLRDQPPPSDRFSALLEESAKRSVTIQ
jgi:flagellar biogenesis protein FliO